MIQNFLCNKSELWRHPSSWWHHVFRKKRI